jgi:hypothetical protein
MRTLSLSGWLISSEHLPHFWKCLVAFAQKARAPARAIPPFAPPSLPNARVAPTSLFMSATPGGAYVQTNVCGTPNPPRYTELTSGNVERSQCAHWREVYPALKRRLR